MNSSDFELRLSSQLRELAQRNLTPIDPLALAQDVVGRRRGVLGRLPIAGAHRTGRLLWIAALIGLLIVGLLTFAYVGSRVQAPTPTAPPHATTPAVDNQSTAPPSTNSSAVLQQLAAVRHGDLYLGATDGTLIAAEVRTAIDNPDQGLPSQADLKAVRWSPDGARLIAAIGQQPGDPLWHGLALIDNGGTLRSVVSEGLDFAWAHDSEHLLVMPLDPTEQRPSYGGLDLFPSSGFGTLNDAASTNLGITQAGLPLGAGWQDSEVVVVLANVLVEENGFAQDPDQTVSVWLANVGGDGPAQDVYTTNGSLAAAIDPSGTKVALVDRTSLTVASLDGSPGCTISVSGTGSSTDQDPLMASVKWSPHGGSVAVALTGNGRSGLWTVPSECSSSTELASGTYEPGATYLDDESGTGTPPLNTTSGENVRGPLAWDNNGFIYYTALTAANEGDPVSPPDYDLRRVPATGGPSELVARGVEYFDLN